MADMGPFIHHSNPTYSLQGKGGRKVREEAQELSLLQRANTIVYGIVPRHGPTIVS